MIGSLSTTIMNRISTTVAQCNSPLVLGMRAPLRKSEEVSDLSEDVRGGPQPDALQTGRGRDKGGSIEGRLFSSRGLCGRRSARRESRPSSPHPGCGKVRGLAHGEAL